MSARFRSMLLALVLGLALVSPALAEETPKPDDKVQMDLSAENWVATKTARVIVSVEAAVSSSNAGSMRTSMMKSVGDIAKADWRLTAFNRSQDQTGLERWSALFEARLPEADLGGLNETAKKLSKAGMQLSIASVDFIPTLDEIQTTLSQIRAQIYKSAQEQLSVLNTTMPGRAFRISSIEFVNDNHAYGRPMMMAAKLANDRVSAAGDASGMERSEKITLTAHVIMAAAPNVSK